MSEFGVMVCDSEKEHAREASGTCDEKKGSRHLFVSLIYLHFEGSHVSLTSFIAYAVPGYFLKVSYTS
jgi:hypothetical protein